MSVEKCRAHPGCLVSFLDNDENKQWTLITVVPHLKLIHALSFFEDRLHVSEPVLKANEEYDSRLLRSYDFKKNLWIELSNAP